MEKIPPPTDRQTLLNNAKNIAGITLRQLSEKLNVVMPASTLRAKGWVGQLLETALGANASNMAEPDFLYLGIELKTIPLNIQGNPKESTYVCLLQLEPAALKAWETSLVKRKLTEVLWVPVEADKSIPLGQRRIGSAILWKPDSAQEKQLRQDWQEISDRVAMGQLHRVSSSMGEYLQIRPKAANAKALSLDKNQTSADMLTLPRGFYLRPSFTRTIISR